MKKTFKQHDNILIFTSQLNYCFLTEVCMCEWRAML